MPRTVILSSARTPIGRLGGGLSSLPATELGAIAIREALERADVAPEQVEHVVMGTVLQAGQGQIPSRQAQIKGGIPKEVPSETINKVCASGMRSVGLLGTLVRNQYSGQPAMLAAWTTAAKVHSAKTRGPAAAGSTATTDSASRPQLSPVEDVA